MIIHINKDYLDNHAEDIETLILGSSHSYYGLNPKYFTSKTFNASHVSQSIDLDLEILKLYLKKEKNLNHIVLPVDYFTLFTRTSLGQERWRLKNYNIYYGINQSYDIKENSELLSFSVKKNRARLISYYIDGKNKDISCSMLGYGNLDHPQKNLIETGKSSALSHAAENISFFPKNVEVLNSILKLAEDKNINVLLFTNPAYSTYVENLAKTQLNRTLITVNEICQKFPNCTHENLLTNARFKKNDFRDADHLNKNGARKLSKMIDELIIKSQRAHKNELP